MCRGPDRLFITEGETARRLGIGRSSLIDAIGRGEVRGVVRVGRSVRIFWPAVVLDGLGTDLGALAKQLGVEDMGELLRFLGGER